MDLSMDMFNRIDWFINLSLLSKTMKKHNHEHHKQQYTCPMHPQIIQDEPGNCPLCGMTLIPLKKTEDTHHGHTGHISMIDDFRKRFYVVLILTIPIMLLSEMIQHWLGLPINFPGSQYLLFALSTIVFLYGGWPFLKGLTDEVKAKNPGMMFLIGFAITVAYIYSVAVVFGLPGFVAPVLLLRGAFVWRGILHRQRRSFLFSGV